MRFPVHEVWQKYQLPPIEGVIHVGGHHGEELGAYVREGVLRTLWVEPQAKQFAEMTSRIGWVPGVHLVNAALGPEEGEAEMYVETANDGASSSLLPPHLHLTQHPHIVFHAREKVRVLRLDQLPFTLGDYTMLVLDVQGYELEVLKGATETLPHIQAIQCEIAQAENYKGGAFVNDIDGFLRRFGLHRVRTVWDGGDGPEGEGLWVR